MKMIYRPNRFYNAALLRGVDSMRLDHVLIVAVAENEGSSMTLIGVLLFFSFSPSKKKERKKNFLIFLFISNEIRMHMYSFSISIMFLQVTLEPYERDHAVVVGVYRSQKKKD